MVYNNHMLYFTFPGVHYTPKSYSMLHYASLCVRHQIYMPCLFYNLFHFLCLLCMKNIYTKLLCTLYICSMFHVFILHVMHLRWMALLFAESTDAQNDDDNNNDDE